MRGFLVDFSYVVRVWQRVFYIVFLWGAASVLSSKRSSPGYVGTSVPTPST